MLLNQAHSNIWRRFVLCILMFAWVNSSAQPCAMVADDQESPPIAEGHDHAGHSNHGSPAEGVERCGHCPPGGEHVAERCADGINASCGALPEVSADGRKAESKLKAPTVSPEMASFHIPGDRSSRSVVTVPLDPGLLKRQTNPPLSLRHCVFLK
jgi:hypothetical protein